MFDTTEQVVSRSHLDWYIPPPMSFDREFKPPKERSKRHMSIWRYTVTKEDLKTGCRVSLYENLSGFKTKKIATRSFDKSELFDCDATYEKVIEEVNRARRLYKEGSVK